MRALFALASIVSLVAAAQVPSALQYSGRLLRADGAPRTGAPTLSFSLYSASTGGVPRWTETRTVLLDEDGAYSTALGSLSAVDLAGEAWLELSVDGVTLTPRSRLSAVPSALLARAVQGGPVDATSLLVNGTTVVLSDGRVAPAALPVRSGLANGETASVALQSCVAQNQVLSWDVATGAWRCGNATGPTGEPGVAGSQGPQGVPGPPGPQGAPGNLGPKGATGDRGPDGVKGPAGDASGAVGTEGPKGPKGDQGNAGPPGVNGIDVHLVAFTGAATSNVNIAGTSWTETGATVTFTLSDTRVVTLVGEGSANPVPAVVPAAWSCGFRFVIDNTPSGDGQWGDRLAGGHSTRWVAWSMRKVVTMGPGQHTVKVQGTAGVAGGHCSLTAPRDDRATRITATYF